MKQKKFKLRKSKILRFIKNIFTTPLTYLCIAMPIVMAILIVLTYKYEAGISMESMGDSIWNFLVVFVAGYYDICVVTPWGRFFSFIILVLGIAIFTIITGKIASIFMNIQMNKDKGLVRLKNMEGHFLLCGWRSDFEHILDSVLNSNPDITADLVVLVNNAPSEQVQQLRSLSRFKEVKYISGDYSDEEILRKAMADKASRALIISDPLNTSSKLEMDSKTVLTVLTLSSINPAIYIAAEIADRKFERHLQMAHCDEIILTSNYEYSLLATASSGVGYSNVIKELIGDDAYSGILIEDIPRQFIGKTYGEFKAQHGKESVLIGILLNTGNFYTRRKEALREAQKNPDFKKVVDNLKKVKLLKSNEPIFNPSDGFVIPNNSKAILVKGKIKNDSEESYE